MEPVQKQQCAEYSAKEHAHDVDTLGAAEEEHVDISNSAEEEKADTDGGNGSWAEQGLTATSQ